jgi:hypothetical protein
VPLDGVTVPRCLEADEESGRALNIVSMDGKAITEYTISPALIGQLDGRELEFRDGILCEWLSGKVDIVFDTKERRDMVLLAQAAVDR